MAPRKDKPGKTDYNVDAETFITTWQQAESAQEVADKLKMPKDIVLARASTYRGAGIRLKKMPGHRNKALDVQALNALIDDLERQKGIIRGVFGQTPAAPDVLAKAMKNAVALTTTFYDCPRCPRRNHFREIFVSREEIVPMDCRAGVCKDCGHRLTKKEAQPILNGGVLRSGWWYTCSKCGHDCFVDVAVDGEPAIEGHPQQLPPPRVICDHCGDEGRLDLADDS
jgi:hypothetical protein